MSSFADRIDGYNTIREGFFQRLKNKSELSWSKLQQYFEFVHFLDKGENGEVFVAKISGKLPPIAVKVATRTYSGDLDELFVNECTTAMVRWSVLPNYPLLYGSFKTDSDVILLQELSLCDAHHYISEHPGLRKSWFFAFFFQVFIAGLGLHLMWNIVHNDVKITNVLIDRVRRGTIFRYQVGSLTYELKSLGYLFKLTDYGLMSGPLMSRSHEKLPKCAFPKDRTLIGNWASSPWAQDDVHALCVDIPAQEKRRVNLPVFARDYWMVLNGFVQADLESKFPEFPVAWLNAAGDMLTKLPMNTPADSLEYFKKIFDPEFISTTEKTNESDLPLKIIKEENRHDDQDPAVIENYSLEPTMKTSTVLRRTVGMRW